MAHVMSLLCALVLLLAFIAPSAAQANCGSICRFRLCSLDEPTGVDPPGRRVQIRASRISPPTPLICLTGLDDEVGYVTKIGDPLVEISDTVHVPFNQYRPTRDGMTLAPKFPRRFFRVGNVPRLRRSSIVRFGQYRGNQEHFLDLICVKIPIIKYEMVKRTKKKVRPGKIIMTDQNPEDCVAFQPSIMTILADLTWEGADQLDLSITEPDGTVLNRITPNTARGNFDGDEVKNCGKTQKLGAESAFYKKRTDGRRGVFIPRGEFIYDVDIFKKCKKPARVRWNLRITVDGVLKVSIGGIIDADSDTRIAHGPFRFDRLPKSP